MRKLLNKPWFVAVVALAAILLVTHLVFSNGENVAGSGSDAAAAATDSTAAAEETAHVSTVAILKSLPIPSLLRDPFAVRVKTELAEKQPEPDSVDTVHLSAIWTQNGQTLVVINDHIFQGGDEIGRLKIESASADGVWLKHWKGRDFLSIGGSFTLNTPAGKISGAASL
jgi:hypothetical protein